MAKPRTVHCSSPRRFLRTRCLAALLILALSCTLTGAHNADNFSRIIADLSITDEMITHGSLLVVNCTIQSFGTNNQTSEDIYFKLGNERLDAYTRVLGENIAQLTWPADGHMSRGHLFCYLDNYLDPISLQPLSVDQATITIAEPPLKPSLEGCIVYNWLRMECTWSPEEQNSHTGLPTTQRLKYTLKDALGPASCPLPQASNMCAWERGVRGKTFMIDTPHAIVIVASNALGEARSREITLTPSRLVKPNSVQGQKVSSITNTSLTVSWRSPLDGISIVPRSLLYHVTCTAQWSNITQVVADSRQVNTTSVSLKISDLNPHTTYRVVVIAIPVVKGQAVGFWSDPVAKTATTLEGVPGAVPLMTVGAFSVLPGNGGKRIVVLYWKRIPRHLEHGTITGYRLKYHSLPSLPGASQQDPYVLYEDGGREKNMFRLELHMNRSYRIGLEARTSVGFNSKLTPSSINIPASYQVMSGPKNVVAMGDETGVYMMWQPVAGAGGYTVFWCEGSSTGHRCKDDLQWQILPSNQTSINLSVADSHFDKYIVAVSAEAERQDSYRLPGVPLNATHKAEPLSHKLTGSSGMIWAECIYDSNNEVKPPSNFKISGPQHANSLSVTWSRPDCQHSGYFTHFLLMYCREDICQEQGGWHLLEVNKGETRALVEGIEGGHIYNLKMASMVDSKPSQFTPVISTHVKSVWTMPMWGAILVAIAAVVMVCLVVLGLVTLYRKCSKGWQQYTSIAITIPGQTGKKEANHAQVRSELDVTREEKNYFHGETCAGTDIENNENNIKEKVWINGDLTSVSFSTEIHDLNNGNSASVLNGHVIQEEQRSLLSNGNIRPNSEVLSERSLPSLPHATHGKLRDSGYLENRDVPFIEEDVDELAEAQCPSAYSTLDEVIGSPNAGPSACDSSGFSSISPYTLADCVLPDSLPSLITSLEGHAMDDVLSSADLDDSTHNGSAILSDHTTVVEGEMEPLPGDSEDITNSLGEDTNATYNCPDSSQGVYLSDSNDMATSPVSHHMPVCSVSSSDSVSDEAMCTNKVLESGDTTGSSYTQNLSDTQPNMCSVITVDFHSPLEDVSLPNSGYVTHDVIGHCDIASSW